MENVERIQALTDDEIIAKINAGVENVHPGVDFWFRELDRRQSARATDRAERLTRSAVRLTVANLVVAVIAAAAALATLF